MKDLTRFTIILFSICVISAGMLALIHSIAEPRIIEQQKLQEKRAIEEVLPQSPASIEKVDNEEITFYKAKDKDGALIAYVFITQARGYSSDIKTVVSLTPDGNIIAVKILEQRDTPGVGSRITEEGFLGQFINRNFNSQFDAITGATISSRAVIDSIKQTAEKVLSVK